MPGNELDAFFDGFVKHLGGLEAGEVDVFCKVVDQLADLHVVASPEGDSVEFQFQVRAGHF